MWYADDRSPGDAVHTEVLILFVKEKTVHSPRMSPSSGYMASVAVPKLELCLRALSCPVLFAPPGSSEAPDRLGKVIVTLTLSQWSLSLFSAPQMRVCVDNVSSLHIFTFFYETRGSQKAEIWSADFSFHGSRPQSS